MQWIVVFFNNMTFSKLPILSSVTEESLWIGCTNLKGVEVLWRSASDFNVYECPWDPTLNLFRRVFLCQHMFNRIYWALRVCCSCCFADEECKWKEKEVKRCRYTLAPGQTALSSANTGCCSTHPPPQSPCYCADTNWRNHCFKTNILIRNGRGENWKSKVH